MRILVTTGEWQGALTCVESFGELGHEVHVLAHDRRAVAAASRHCARRLDAPPERSPGAWGDALVAAVRGGGYDLVVPMSDAAVAVAGARRAEIEPHAALPLSPDDAVAVAGDKAETTRLAEALGLAVPPTRQPGSRAGLLAAAAALGYPCVVKRPRSVGSQGVAVVASPGALEAFLDRPGTGEGEPLVQAFEAGELVDVAGVCDRGRLVAAFAFAVEARHLVGGTPPYARTVEGGAAMEAAARLCEALGWHGAVDFDFLRTPDGRDVLLEINPRFSGTIELGRCVGVDLPAALVAVVEGRAPASPMPVRPGLRASLGVENELAWLGGDLGGRWREVLRARADRGLLRPRRRGDPGLVLAQVALGLRRAARAWRRRRRGG